MTVTVTKKLPHGKIPFAQMTNAELRDFAMKCNENFVALQNRLMMVEQAVTELQRKKVRR